MLKLSKEFLKKDYISFSFEDTKKLQKIINYHSNLYYNLDSPIISDKEYDELFNKLKKLENKFSADFVSNLVTNKV
jgi:DNA ligase (NAD+)